MTALCLAIDGSSPVSSAALAAPGELLAEATAPARGGRSLLELVDDCFRAAGREIGEAGTVVAVCGPGSFTGVRVTLATAMGLVPRPAAVRLRGISSLAALALQTAGSARVVALVDALQGEWFHQAFAGAGGGLRPLDEPWRSRAADLRLDGAVVVGFESAAATAAGVTLPARALAAPLALAVASGEAEAILETELRPIYLRAPAVTPPRVPAIAPAR